MSEEKMKGEFVLHYIFGFGGLIIAIGGSFHSGLWPGSRVLAFVAGLLVAMSSFMEIISEKKEVKIEWWERNRVLITNLMLTLAVIVLIIEVSRGIGRYFF